MQSLQKANYLFRLLFLFSSSACAGPADTTINGNSGSMFPEWQGNAFLGGLR